MIFKKKNIRGEYKRSYLPKNRIESIKDIMSLQSLTLLKMGLLLLLFGIPLILHQIFLNISIYEIEMSYRLGQISSAYAEKALNDTFNLGHLIRIPLLLILGIGLSGVLRIIRQLIFQEPIFFFNDFKKGIHSHLHYVLISMFLLGSTYYIFHAIIRNSHKTDNNLMLNWSVVLSIVLLLTVILISIFVISQTTLYQLTFVAIYKNALLFMMRYFFQTMGLTILLFSPWFLLFIELNALFIVVFVILFILLPFAILILLQYTYHIYDETINQSNYQEIYKKGIYHA